ncbi:glycoside hydrolase family 95-like protein [Flavobacterium sp. JAS]|uniref:glycosyl hydrolase family 95 catalytic domain-containing protein n=1 Tax=Flavobacterium sp. JAS TaxID=2897329 RepID=UPI001E4D3434|nr:glycoside hydrolase N-terminal domain-containing protein [Flavobacterium sp. JAS]MCD0468938.1 glycoside hydrolase N-terminal domain-containing protein [Flavobacterium sp. JAS]
MKNISSFLIFVLMVCAVNAQQFSGKTQPVSQYELNFKTLATTWDEGIPLGNGMIGALVWQKGNNLRMSLDRADLWDIRPMKDLHLKEFSYKWVEEQVEKKEYDIVQKYFDDPYDNEPAPSKIPGGSLEFDIQNWGTVTSVKLSLKDAICEVKWDNGTILKTFVHATQPIGWFRFENLKEEFTPHLLMPKYQGEITNSGDPVGGDDLARLGYKQGKVTQEGNSISYEQEGWGGFKYQISLTWKKINNTTIEGVWSISSQDPNKEINPLASSIIKKALQRGYNTDLKSHTLWWAKFWNQSAIQIPDSLLEKQWYLEQYKFGSAARKGAPPISLQAVWTADNGRLPPWKGDYHHDLNTQLSYWPSYSSNHLEEAAGYIDHLEKNKANYKRYTKMYFGVDGLAVPGVTTLDGTEMGGWIQYSLSPTVSAWLGHHYYLQWRYSMDRKFLEQKAYPWIKDVAKFLEQITVKDEKGFRKLPISSSPETNDNDISAWFNQNSNYDLALMTFTFKAASELAEELGLKQEAIHWKQIQNEFPDYAISVNNEMMITPTLPYNNSHRHFSHLMAIHPLGLIKWEDGEKSQALIKNTIKLLDTIGPDYWCGYSYSWMANIKARAKDGEGAAKDLEIFAKAFCLKNSFHVNGDQTKSGYSKFQYRPFTLEGNFAFAAGLQEMLLQSYAGFIEIMPAVPVLWKNISYDKLRAEGAFIISASKENGLVKQVKIVAEQGGKTKLKIPFKNWIVDSKNSVKIKQLSEDFLELTFKKNGSLVLKNNPN